MSLRARMLAGNWNEPRAAGSHAGATAGQLASEAWLHQRGLTAPTAHSWHVEVTLDVRDAPAQRDFDDRKDTRFRIEIYSIEWGFFFCHGGHSSWIRVTDIPVVHGRDDFRLLAMMPPLKDIGGLLRRLEKQHAIAFRREHAYIRTNVPSAEPAIRLWVQSL